MNSDNIGLEKDITRDEFKDWINEHPNTTFLAFGGMGAIGKTFLYPRRETLPADIRRKLPGTTKLEILQYYKDRDDRVIGEILIPPDGFPYLTARKMIEASSAGKKRWFMPRPAPSRSFPARQRDPYPRRPHNDRTLFYVLYDKKNDSCYTYPGSQAVLCMYCRPLVEAFREMLNREAFAAKTSNTYRDYAVVNDDSPQWDEIPYSLFYEKNGWMYKKETSDPGLQTPADG